MLQNSSHVKPHVGNIEFDYLDRGKGAIVLEYDSTDLSAPLRGAFKAVKAAALEESGGWKTAKVMVEDPAFTGRANGNDFRLSSPGAGLVLHRVAARKR